MQPNFGYRVLLADDNDFNRQLACALLEEHGCHVTLAEDGACAVASFREHPFDLILMDVNMPGMDGLEAARSIRGIEQSRGSHRIPIFAVTATAAPEERRACLASGMDDVLAKPLSVSDVEEGLKKCGVKPRPEDHPALSPGGGAVIGIQAGGTAADAAAMDGLLSERILADFGASPDRLATYFRLLCNDIATQLAAMNAAYGANDRDGLRKAAHAAKGVARGLRDQNLSDLAARIEDQAQSGSIAGVQEALADFLRIYRSFSCI